jgi:hypothetical protein
MVELIMHTTLALMLVGVGSLTMFPYQMVEMWNRIIRYLLNMLDRAIEREIIRIADKYKSNGG